ncbi:unnamed protein product [Adineta ricciae]|uniref:Uncharacterized protein n=1 Tax=Adineta ricciae TaxID=249248 RepID=A0A814ZHL1_ADIRI|nr:unnamed protein product [Adineta ricciae]
MGSRRTNTKGKQLQELINEGFLNCVDDSITTFEKNDYEEKIDWILASQPLFSFISNVETHPTLGLLSGHKPLTFDISIGTEVNAASPRLSLNFKRANWRKYRNTLDEKLKTWNKPGPTLPGDIDDYAEFVTNCITTASNLAIPTASMPNTNFKVSEASQHMIKNKHQAYRRWKKTGEAADKQQFYSSQVLLANSLRNDRRHKFKQLMESLCRKKMYSDEVWLTVRKFHNKRIKQTYSSTMQYNNTIAATGKEKADIFADYFEKEVYFKVPDMLPFHKQVVRQTKKVKKGMLHPSTTTKSKKFSTKEVKWHIKQLRNSATGPDNVHNRCLKKHTELFVQHLTALYNAILEEDTYYLTVEAEHRQASTIQLSSHQSPELSRLHPRKKYKHSVEVKVENTTIKPLDATGYLGVIIDKELKWRNHLQHLESKMTGRISLLRYLVKSAQEPNQKTMINIFKAIARSVMTYGYPVLLTANEKVWDRLQIIQNKALRATLGLSIDTSVEYVHRISKIPTIKEYATSLLHKSFNTASSNKGQTLLLRSNNSILGSNIGFHQIRSDPASDLLTWDSF